MPITVPGQENISLGVSRGSSITPMDTYARPAIPDKGSGLEELSKSLSGLGGQFTQLAAEQGQAKEQQDLERIDQHVSTIRSQFGSQAITDTQLGIALPDSNYLVKTRVGEQLGSIAAQEALAAEQEKLLADPDLRLDPQRMDQRLKELEAQACQRRLNSDPLLLRPPIVI